MSSEMTTTGQMPSPYSKFTFPQGGYQLLSATVPANAPFPSNFFLPASDVSIVPRFHSYGYESLDHGYSNATSTSGFFPYKQAYPTNNCGVVVYRKCDASYNALSKSPIPVKPFPGGHGILPPKSSYYA